MKDLYAISWGPAPADTYTVEGTAEMCPSNTWVPKGQPAVGGA